MKTVVKTLKTVLLLAVIFFVARLFVQSLSEIGRHEVAFDPRFLGVAVLFHSLYLLSRALLWHAITRVNGIGIGLWRAVYAWFTSLLGKFIPGKVFYLGARVYCYTAAGKPAAKVTYSFFIEFVVDTIASVLMFLTAFHFIPESQWSDYRTVGVFLIAALLVIVHPGILNAILKGIGRYTRRQPPGLLNLSYGKVIYLVLVGFACKLLLGTGFFFLIRTVYALPGAYLLYVTGSFALASIIGIVSLFAPSGIGVREAVIIATLSQIMPLSIASFVAVIARLWATGSEVFWTTMAYVVNKTISGRECRLLKNAD